MKCNVPYCKNQATRLYRLWFTGKRRYALQLARCDEHRDELMIIYEQPLPSQAGERLSEKEHWHGIAWFEYRSEGVGDE